MPEVHICLVFPRQTGLSSTLPIPLPGVPPKADLLIFPECLIPPPRGMNPGSFYLVILSSFFGGGGGVYVSFSLLSN